MKFINTWSRVLLIYSLLTALNFDTSDTTPANSRRLTYMENLPANLRSQRHTCQSPQPRAYHLGDLFKVLNLPPAETPISPVYLVVQRCDNHSGCCFKRDSACRPVDICYEELEILILNISDIHGSLVRRNITVEQHRKCNCTRADIKNRQAMENILPKIGFTHLKPYPKCGSDFNIS